MTPQDSQQQLLKLESQLKELQKTPSGRRAFLAALPLLLAACATKKTRYREGDNSGQQSALTVSEEKKLTAEALPKMRKDYPPLKNANLQNYVSGLGQELVRRNGLHKKPYTYNFSVVDVPYVNAFALPAGTVFVTAPLIAMASTEAELVGVIGHEVGHIQARHTAERMHKAKEAQSKSWAYLLGGGLLGGAVGYGLGTLMCNKRDRDCLARAAKYGAMAGVGGGLLIQKYAFMAHSREDEMEADRIGFQTSVRSGYHKDYVGRFFEKLLKMEEKSKNKQNALMAYVADAMSTHPPSRERVKQMNEMANHTNQRSSAKVNTKTFDRMRKLAHKYSKASRQKA